MKRVFLFLTLVIISSVSGNFVVVGVQAEEKLRAKAEAIADAELMENYKKGMILVSFPKRTSREEAEKVLARHGLVIQKSYRNIQISTVDPGDKPESRTKRILIDNWNNALTTALVLVQPGKEKLTLKQLIQGSPEVQWVELIPVEQTL